MNVRKGCIMKFTKSAPLWGEITVPGDKLYCAIGGSNMEEVERSIQGMKQKLREKKM